MQILTFVLILNNIILMIFVSMKEFKFTSSLDKEIIRKERYRDKITESLLVII